MVHFRFDDKKCILPLDVEENRPTKCLKCLDVCPAALLMFVPMGKKHNNKPPEQFKIHMVFNALSGNYCPQCLKCVEICPAQAIKIT